MSGERGNDDEPVPPPGFEAEMDAILDEEIQDEADVALLGLYVARTMSEVEAVDLSGHPAETIAEMLAIVVQSLFQFAGDYEAHDALRQMADLWLERASPKD